MCSFSRSYSRSSVSVDFSLPPGPVVFCPACLVQFLIFAHRSKAIGNQLPIAGKYFPFPISFLFLHFICPSFPSISSPKQSIHHHHHLFCVCPRSTLRPTSHLNRSLLSPLSPPSFLPLFSLNPPLALHLPPHHLPSPLPSFTCKNSITLVSLCHHVPSDSSPILIRQNSFSTRRTSALPAAVHCISSRRPSSAIHYA